MNETMRAILDIDRSTKELADRTQQTLDQEMDNTRQVMSKLQKEIQASMRQETEEKIKAIEENRIKEESALKSTLDEQIAMIWRFFDGQREVMAEEWFEKLRDDDGI